jgi:regulatory protein
MGADRSESASRWQGDVSAGVRAWTGDPPPDPVADGPDADPESVARKILLDALTGQARSRQELRDKLAKRDVPADLAERLLDRFTEVGLVDDEAFARSWVESRQRSRGLARRALAQELRRKGVDDETARTALDDLDPADEEEAARALVRKKLRSLRAVDRTTATRRLAGLLARKGYPAGMAFAVVRAELGAADDDGPTYDAQ